MSEPAGAFTFVNANVLTMDPARPRASSIAVGNGRISAIDDAQNDTAIDLGGATVLPGFIDSHLHCALGGQALTQLDLSALHSRAEFEAAIGERAQTLSRDAWLVASGWNEDALEGRTLPDRTWLAAAGPRPVVCWRMDHHACVVNDAVLARLDLSRDPNGGRIVRDSSGAATGLLQEAAAWQLVRPIVPEPSAEEWRSAVRAAHTHLAALGITTAGSMEYGHVVRDAIAPLRDELLVRMRVTLLDREWPVLSGVEAPLDLSFATRFANDDRLAIIGMKAFVDGTLGSRTARMFEDYSDDPGNRGLFVELAARGVLVEWARLVKGAGLSPSMHAIGDAAARLALDVSAASGAANARIEHAQTVAPADFSRFRGRFASMQPLHKAYDARSAASRLGAARMDRFFPFRSLKAHGARLAFGSDWPIVSADPMLGIAAAVTGRDVDGRVVRAEENISVLDALVAYTREAAACLGFDNAGVLRVGAHADLVVLDRDPLACDWTSARPRVLATVMRGRSTFEGPR